MWGLQVTEFGGPVTGGLRILRVLNGPQQAASGGDGCIFSEAKSCQIGDAKLSFKEPPGFIHPAGPRRDRSRMDSHSRNAETSGSSSGAIGSSNSWMPRRRATAGVSSDAQG